MTAGVTGDGGVTPLAFAGDLTIAAVAEFRHELLEVLEAGQPLHLDLANTTDIDTAGLQLVLAARAEAESRKLPFRVVGTSGSVDQVLELVGRGPDLEPSEDRR